ncbi:MAG: hypothetical protein ACKVTZ_22315 [Bacteroidia bacterium]
MNKKYGHEFKDTNLSFVSESTVSNALKGENPNLIAKLLLYLNVEHNVDYEDFIKEDKTEYYKIIGEEINHYKELNSLYRSIASIEPENRISKVILKNNFQIKRNNV